MSQLDESREAWASLSALLDEGLDLPRGDRTRWIDSLPPQHDAIRPRLRRLLAGVDSAGTDAFLRTLPKVDFTNGVSGHPDDAAPPDPESIAPYRVIRLLGTGGMGAVWLAHRTDVMVNRPIALKLPRGLARRGARRADGGGA